MQALIGLSEILYAYTSGTGNNGSAFAGISANTYWYNTTIGIAMLFGRFLMIIPMLALAGNLARRICAAVTRHVSCHDATLRDASCKRHRDCWCTDVFPCIEPGTDCRASAHVRRANFLIEDLKRVIL